MRHDPPEAAVSRPAAPASAAREALLSAGPRNRSGSR
jgi:hypothetical protein